MTDKTAIVILEEELDRVSFPDKAEEALEALCRFHVEGPDYDFLFGGSHDSESIYVPMRIEEGHVTPVSERTFCVSPVVMELLQRADVITTQNDGETGGRFILPTDKGIEIYEKLRQEGRLDERGYLIKTST